MIKFQVDKLIDLAAPPPKGTGVSNIRECIIQDKMTFDVSADEWQTYLKEKIMNNIERYVHIFFHNKTETKFMLRPQEIPSKILL